MSEFIWFFGASGVGKETLVKSVGSGEFKIPGLSGPFKVADTLDWGRTKRHAELEALLSGYAKQDANYLIKGQNTDLHTTRIPYILKEKFPDLKQRIVFVYTKVELLDERVAERRADPNDKYWPIVDHNFEEEMAMQIREVGELCTALKVEPLIVDNSGPQPVYLSSTTLTDLKV